MYFNAFNFILLVEKVTYIPLKQTTAMRMVSHPQSQKNLNTYVDNLIPLSFLD